MKKELYKNYLLEKSLFNDGWIIFQKKGTSGWVQIYKTKKKNEAKKWIERKSVKDVYNN